MCGIAGIARGDGGRVSRAQIGQMLSAIRHRGPDGAGCWTNSRAGLGHVRLSVLDHAGGAQPQSSDDGMVHLVYNGEVFNHAELRHELARAGHRFRTRSDTEVVLRAWEAWGESMLDRLNGQFAFAICDERRGTLFLARDRFGILPLYYAERRGDLVFGSEIKALLASGLVDAAPDPAGIDEVFTFWAVRPPRTLFRGVRSLEPGCCARWADGRLSVRRYYALDLSEAPMDGGERMRRLDELLHSAVRLRLQADVPVGAYLSGGLDSSITTALAAETAQASLRTFSVTFADRAFDESAQQAEVVARMRTRHAMRHVQSSDVASALREVVWHAETPLVRTAPAPMLLLSRLVRDRGVKVVLSGEGADEIFLGYELFKETMIRRNALEQPGAGNCGAELAQLYAGHPARGRQSVFWREFFLRAGPVGDPLFSHLPRFGLTSRIKEFYSREFRDRVASFDALEELRGVLPAAFARWSPLARAAWLEMTTLLSPYLLSTQGDRMAMASGVELRVPFLDHRLVEFAAAMPASEKLSGLRDKAILRTWASRLLPAAVAERPKQAYRAPDVAPFIGADAPPWVDELLEPSSLRDAGVFDPAAVAGLVRRRRAGRPESELERQTLVAILSTACWHRAFGAGGASPVPRESALSFDAGLPTAFHHPAEVA